MFNLGHRNPQVVQVVNDALDTVDIGNHHRLNTAAFTASLPWVIRGLVTGPIGKEIVDGRFER